MKMVPLLATHLWDWSRALSMKLAFQDWKVGEPLSKMWLLCCFHIWQAPHYLLVVQPHKPVTNMIIKWSAKLWNWQLLWSFALTYYQTFSYYSLGIQSNFVSVSFSVWNSTNVWCYLVIACSFFYEKFPIQDVICHLEPWCFYVLAVMKFHLMFTVYLSP